MYKTRDDWVVKVIHWELCKKFKFDHTNKWYMHNLEYALENETYKVLWDFKMQTDHLISTRRLDLVIVNNNNNNKKKKKKKRKKERKKENLLNSGLCRSGWPLSKTERKRKER